MHSKPTADEGFFVNAALGFRTQQLLIAAHRLGVFDALADASLSAWELAGELGCDPRLTETLLRALVALDLLEERDGSFANSQLARDRLVRGAPGYVGHNLSFQARVGELWGSIDEVLRNGRPQRGLDDHVSDAAFAEDYIRAMTPIALRPAAELPSLLGDEPIARILDVGAGPGMYTTALLEAFPQATATLMDLPTSGAVARRLLETHPTRERLQFREGDYRTDDFGHDYDLVLMSHVTHDESPEVVQGMFAKAHACLRPGGRVAVHDWVSDASDGSALFSALFSVNLMLYTEAGRVYALAAYREMLERCGFSNITDKLVLEGIVPNPTHLIVATK